jgi:HAE1 family hydrophobic/amphiphilic exporter-1
MGFTVIGGMLAASCIAIFLIPVIFYLIEKLGGAKSSTLKPSAIVPASATPEGGAH